MKKLFKNLEKLSEIMGFILIVGAFILIAVGITFVISYIIKDLIGIVIGIIIGLLVILFGVYTSIKAYRGNGTIYLLTRTIASPDLDSKEDEINLKRKN